MHHPILGLAENYLGKVRLKTQIVSLNDPWPVSLDFGLRSQLIASAKFRSFLDDLDPQLFGRHYVYYVRDSYLCHYIVLPIPEQEAPLLFVTGPYMTEHASLSQAQILCRQLGVSAAMVPFLMQYYATIPFIENLQIMEGFFESLADALFGPGQYSIQAIIEKEDAAVTFAPHPPMESSQDTRSLIEKRYAIEARMMDAISHGDTETAIRCVSSKVFSDLDDRGVPHLRSRKNYMIILNTLCRKAAERANVHPVYLDSLSRSIAISIEDLSSIAELSPFEKEIVRKYCLLVGSQQTKGYSPLVRKIILHISCHLTEPLSLRLLADTYSVNRSYLSTLFHKETGSTLTDYINDRRIDQAIFLMNTQDQPIQEIASACGIEDLTYFTRLFRRRKGISPSEYRKKLQQ
ncbi:MAG: helix-turn-helix transcriptional regulator [Firmicutes bacterium]|nr:helix-turn-helix transcriptional regulator [Bacillota bacterium]